MKSSVSLGSTIFVLAVASVTECLAADDQWRVYVYNVDDIMTVKVNGKAVGSVPYRGTGNFQIANHLKLGKNTLELELTNTGGPWTYGYSIFKNESAVATNRCGDNAPNPSTPCGGQETGVVWRYPHSITKFSAPTLVSKTKMRGGPGIYGYRRVKGSHQAVDIVPLQSSMDRTDYQVVAAGSGIVAYARVNGDPGDGYGYTVIVEHSHGVYTLYAHLALLASQTVVKVGQQVARGAILGYMADLQNAERSTGNVLDCKQVPLPIDKIQLHFDVFENSPGRRGDSIRENFKKGARSIDPTPLLREVGYGVHDPSPTHQQPSPDCKDPEH